MADLPLFDGPDYEIEDEPDYDDHAHARASDPDTSHEAAAAVNMGRRQTQVVEQLAVVYPKGWTSYEVSDRLCVDIECISPAFRPLVRKGLICDSGERRVGKKGRKQIVWKLTEKGALHENV